MRRKTIMRFLFLLPLVIVLLGCGRKGPPTLPEKHSSIIKAKLWTQVIAHSGIPRKSEEVFLVLKMNEFNEHGK
jgi:hypothetical protein